MTDGSFIALNALGSLSYSYVVTTMHARLFPTEHRKTES